MVCKIRRVHMDCYGDFKPPRQDHEVLRHN